MDKTIKRYLEQVLRDYPQINDYIEGRVKQLSYFNHNFEVNPSPNETKGMSATMLAINIDTDRRLTQLELNRDAVNYCLDTSDTLTNTIITELYFKLHPTLNFEGIALKYHTNKATISRRRTQFFELLAKKLGLV